MSERDDEILFNNVYGLDNLPPLRSVTYTSQVELDEYYRIRNKEIAINRASSVQNNIKNKKLAQEEKQEHYQRQLELKQKQDNYRRQLELLHLFAKQRSVLNYRINAAFKLGRLMESNILKSRIVLYTEQIEQAKYKLSQAIDSSQYRNTIKPTFLTDKEREEETREVINSILHDVVFLLSKVESFSKGELREIVKDCAEMICQHFDLDISTRLRPGQIVQKYITDKIHLRSEVICCTVCGEHYIENLRYCLNCSEKRSL